MMSVFFANKLILLYIYFYPLNFLKAEVNDVTKNFPIFGFVLITIK